MAQVFHDCAHDAHQQRGLTGLVELWIRTLGDLVTTVPREHLAELNTRASGLWNATQQKIERSAIMPWNTGAENHPFTERLAEVLDREPSYYQLLISTEPTHRMSDVVESLALEGDPDHPETMLTLFQELRQDIPEADMERWLTRLRDAAQRIYTSRPDTETTNLADKIMQMMCADPHLYELLVAVEPGYGLRDLVEGLALEVNLDEIEPMMALMRQLCAADGSGNELETQTVDDLKEMMIGGIFPI